MNAAVNAFFLIFKLLSLYFLAVSLFCLCGQKKPAASAGQRRFAILIAARNEESCILYCRTDRKSSGAAVSTGII